MIPLQMRRMRCELLPALKGILLWQLLSHCSAGGFHVARTKPLTCSGRKEQQKGEYSVRKPSEGTPCSSITDSVVLGLLPTSLRFCNTLQNSVAFFLFSFWSHLVVGGGEEKITTSKMSSQTSDYLSDF